MITAAEIRAYVEAHSQEAVDCLTEILQTPSVTGDELAVSRVFAKWIERAGLEVRVHQELEDRPNLIAEWKGSRPGKRFLFNGHMDVFPPSQGTQARFGPWSGKVEDGYIWGRGAADMKGGDCCALMAVLFLKRMGFDPQGSVVLSYMCDEENGGGHGVKYLLREGLLRDADFGICPEPTDMAIVRGHSGILRVRVTYRSDTGHTGTPHPSVDALKKAVTAIGELYRLAEVVARRKDPDYGCSLLSVTVLHAGTAPNTYPSLASFFVDRRLVPGESHDAALGELLEVLDRLKEQNPAFAYEYEVTSDRPFLEIPEEDPFLQLIARSYREVMGEPVRFKRRPGGSDAANIRQATGIPMPNMGPGSDTANTPDFDGSSSPNERIRVEDYLNLIQVFMRVLCNALG